MRCVLFLCALLAAAPLATAAPRPWLCRVGTLSHVSANGARVSISNGDIFSISPRGDFRLRTLSWIRGDKVRVCKRLVNGRPAYRLSDRGTRVQASLDRGAL